MNMCKPICKINSGDKFWYLNDKIHREDGPAIEFSNGDKIWYINGKRHREDGPACEYVDGSKAYYYNNNRIYCKDNEEFLRMIKLIAFL